MYTDDTIAAPKAFLYPIVTGLVNIVEVERASGEVQDCLGHPENFKPPAIVSIPPNDSQLWLLIDRR